MKKIILLISILISFISVKSQQYPSFYRSPHGDTLGIVFSIDQAQKIDNDYDLLNLYKQSNYKYEKLDSAYIIVVNGLNQQVAALRVKISTLEGINTLKDSAISNLKEQISKYKLDLSLADKQSIDKDLIINNYKKENRKLKTQKFLGFTIGGGSLIGIIILLLLKK